MTSKGTLRCNGTTTWLSFGDLTLTLCQACPDTIRYANELPASDPHPDVHFVQPGIATDVGDFGLSLHGARRPITLEPNASRLENFYRERLSRIYQIPVEERLWCFATLSTAYTSVKGYVCDLLNECPIRPQTYTRSKALPATSINNDVLHIDRLHSEEPYPYYPQPYMAPNDKRLAFSIIVHIPAQSHLARYFISEGIPERGPIRQGEEASSSFSPPDWDIQQDPSTWGFEVFSNKKWQQTLDQWSGRIEQRILLQSVIEACDDALARLRQGRAFILATLAEQEQEREQEERLQQLLHGLGEEDLVGNNLSLQGHFKPTTADAMIDSPSTRYGNRRRGRFSDSALLARTDRSKDSSAFVQQLDFTPAFALVRGPPGPMSYGPTASLASTTVSNKALRDRMQVVADARRTVTTDNLSRQRPHCDYTPIDGDEQPRHSPVATVSPSTQRANNDTGSTHDEHQAYYSEDSSSDCATPRPSSPVREEYGRTRTDSGYPRPPAVPASG